MSDPITLANDLVRQRPAFAEGGRGPEADACWGLYRQFVALGTGFALPEEPELVDRDVLGAAARDPARHGFRPVPTGEEGAYDLVLLRTVHRAAGATVLAAGHIGAVIEPGLMIDIDKDTGCLVRAYRATLKRAAHPKLVSRVVGIFRPVALQERP